MYKTARHSVLFCLAVVTLVGFCANAQTGPKVMLTTSHGSITVQLYTSKAPATTANFLKYVDDRFYDGLIFHRVIKGFMIQGGGFDPQMEKRETRKPIALEAVVSNTKGTIAMARRMSPNSATSQFFINHTDNKNLDTVKGGYAVFGRVVEGMDVVDIIANLATEKRTPHANVPIVPAVIKTARRVK
ncbi:MAG: peptidylprolyl isomerase [Myxococcota bacterium]|nr:peptidylprolyl isomerase [Myxococcota bacterium]